MYVCDTRVRNAVSFDPFISDTYQPDVYWFGDPWAIPIQQEMLYNKLHYLPLKEEDLFFLPKKFIYKPRPNFAGLVNEGARNRTKVQNVGYAASFGLNRSLHNEKLNVNFQPRKNSMNLQIDIDTLDSMQLCQYVNRTHIRPLWSYDHLEPIKTNEFGITTIPTASSPAIVAKALIPNNLIDLLDGTTLSIEEWAIDEFDPVVPGRLYMGHRWYYVWYPREIDPLDVDHYKCYLSVVSRIDRLERLIQSALVPLKVQKLLVPIQDMYHQLAYYMEQNSVYLDMELDCFIVTGIPRHEKEVVLPSGTKVRAKMYACSATQQQSVYTTRASNRIKRQGILNSNGIGYASVITYEPSVLGKHWPDHRKIRHNGSLPDFTSFVEHIGFLGKRKKQDVSHIDPDIIKVLDLFLKSAMIPLKKRDMSSFCILHLGKNKLVYTTVYEMVIAGLCGYYPHVQYCTSFYRRHSVYRWFIYNQPSVIHMQEWLNADMAPDTAFVGKEYFDKQNTITSMLKEYVYSLIRLVPAMAKFMDTTFHARRLTIDAFRTMDEYRRMVDNAMYGTGQRWASYQRNCDRYSAQVVKRTLHMRLARVPTEERTCYDVFFLDNSSADFDHSAYLPLSIWNFVVRFFIESVAIFPEFFDPDYSRLEYWLLIPRLWVCKGGNAKDTLQSIITDLVEDRLSIDSAVAAIALRPSYMRRSPETEGSDVAHVRNLLVDIFNAALKTEYQCNAPWKLFGRDSFEDLLEIYIGHDGDIESDHRSCYYIMHGIHLVMDGKMCNCVYCHGARGTERETYRNFQSRLVSGQLGAVPFGPMMTRAVEQMATSMYESGIPYMYRIPNIPFVLYVNLKMEHIIEERNKYEPLQRALANITEFERRWIALFAQSCPVDDVGYQFLCAPPINVDNDVIIRLLKAKNMFVTRSYPKRVYNLLRVFAHDNCRDFAILYMFFGELKMHMMTQVGILPARWTIQQVEACKRRYGKHVNIAKGLPENAGMFWYCRRHGELKGLVLNTGNTTRNSITAHASKKRSNMGHKIVNSFGTVNSAVEPQTTEVYCRTTITNPTLHSFYERNNDQTFDSNVFNRYGAVSSMEDVDVDGDEVMKSDKRSRLKQLALINRQCQRPNEQIQMIGHILYAHETAYVLCTNCATPMPYGSKSFNEYGLNCGECVAAERLEQPQRLSDYVMFACILCTREHHLYQASHVSCYQVIDDTRSGERFMRYIYLCQNHASVDLVKLMPYMTIAKFNKAIAGHIVVVYIDDKSLKYEFGQERRFRQRLNRPSCKGSRKKPLEYSVHVNRYVSTSKDIDLSGFADTG